MDARPVAPGFSRGFPEAFQILRARFSGRQTRSPDLHRGNDSHTIVKRETDRSFGFRRRGAHAESLRTESLSIRWSLHKPTCARRTMTVGRRLWREARHA